MSTKGQRMSEQRNVRKARLDEFWTRAGGMKASGMRRVEEPEAREVAWWEYEHGRAEYDGRSWKLELDAEVRK